MYFHLIVFSVMLIYASKYKFDKLIMFNFLLDFNNFSHHEILMEFIKFAKDDSQKFFFCSRYAHRHRLLIKIDIE